MFTTAKLIPLAPSSSLDTDYAKPIVGHLKSCSALVNTRPGDGYRDKVTEVARLVTMPVSRRFVCVLKPILDDFQGAVRELSRNKYVSTVLVR